MTVGGRSYTAGAALSRACACSHPRIEHLAFISALLFSLLILSACIFSQTAKAQNSKPGVIGLGDLVVSGASGTLPPPVNPPLPPGVNELDETFINPDGASLKIFDVRNPGGLPEAQLLNAPTKYQAFARDIGQVFGLALDKSNPPNIYAASTSVHGLHIVVPDADGDGRPERIKIGQPGAQWMNGQFGVARGGGPGTVWKINGETGEITKFADILSNGAPNSGAGLGNIAFDTNHKQFFVTDTGTGLIHRLDSNGNDLGTFDHGLQGRPANGMNAVPLDAANQLNINSPAFDAEDSQSWGLASPERRTWGIAVRSNRLYYSVEAGPQIWSVGINKDGSFGSDPRWELDVPSDPNAYPVSDIAFTGSGQMLLAQRGGVTSRYDYSQYHTPRKTRVLRYKLESPDDPATPSRWIAEPEDYAIGFPGIHRNASGGIAIGYGYKKKTDGSYGFGSCEGTLWSTGDALRDNPVHGAKLAQGGPLNVHGLQGNALSLVRPQNVPPWSSYYVDFDSQFEDPQASGHVGDVEIPRMCGRKRANIMDLRILKRAKPERCTAGNECEFEVEITNTGNLTYTGPLVIQDIAHNGAELVGHAPPEWDCSEVFAGISTYVCRHPEVTMAPGQSRTLSLTFRTPGWWSRPVYDNCVDLVVPGIGVDQRPYNNRSCDYVAFCTPGEPGCVPDLQLQKFGRYGACDLFGLCEFSVIITNVGPVPYTGQLHVNDFATTPGATMVDWSPKPEWNCAATGANSYGCSTAAPVTLGPGEFRELIILVQGPPIAPGVTHVRNCAYIDWNGGTRDENPHNEFDCAEIANLPPGHPDARPALQIEKDAIPTCERVGVGAPWRCTYIVTVRNSGTAPFIGDLDVSDEVSAHPGRLVAAASMWAAIPCVPGLGNVGPQTCTLSFAGPGFQPGEVTVFFLLFELDPLTPVGSWETNCARINFDNDGDGAAESHESCATAMVCDVGTATCPDDLAIIKHGPDGPCLKGGDCSFLVYVENLSMNLFPGPITVTDVPGAGVGPVVTSTPGWTCVPAGGSYTCTNPAGLPPAPGANSTVFDVTVNIPAGYVGNTLENCADLPAGAPGNDIPGNDHNCAIAVVPQPLPADLGPWSDTTCEKGASCKLPARIDNLGEQIFNGSAGVRGILSPELQISRISSKTSGFSCSKTGNASYECKGNRLSIAPGKAVEYEITVNVPANYPHSQVSHIKNMVWPDQKVKDKNPNNDQHISIITIEQDKTPPPPPPPPAGKPDLAVSKTANQPTCHANSNCNFLITISNVGNAVYSGGITLRDTITPASSRYVGTNPRGWNCTGNAGSVTCTKPSLNLAPGATESIYLTFAVPRYQSGTANNCVLVTPGVAAAPRSGNTVRDVQAALAAQGYYKGRIDGKSGPQTSAAVREYQRLYSMPQTGQINSVLLDRLLGAGGATSGGTDTNPNNNRACASVSIQGEAPPPPPPSCRGGQYLSSRGQCVCPSHKPIWTGSQCIPRKPQQCTGGRVRNYKGICVCPANKPNWSGSYCFAKEVLCSGGRIRQNGICVCPPSLPKWNGKYCSGIPGPQQCTGGRYRNNSGNCVCPSSAPTWTGVICIPKINLCSGGRIFNFQKKKCVCPANKPVWSGSQCNPAHQVCSGGQYYNERFKKCVCPSNKPKWNGYSCSSGGGGGGGCPPGYVKNNHGTCMPGGGSEVTPLPSPICSGGRIRKNGDCVCPSNKPLWIGGKCNSFKLPGGIKFPGIKIQ